MPSFKLLFAEARLARATAAAAAATGEDGRLTFKTFLAARSLTRLARSPPSSFLPPSAAARSVSLSKLWRRLREFCLLLQSGECQRIDSQEKLFSSPPPPFDGAAVRVNQIYCVCR